MPATMHFAEVNGARLAFDPAGAGPTLVLIHGVRADRRMWANQLPAFAAHYRVISYDLRRYGDSNMPLGDFANHQDLAALLEGQGIERAALVGCSLGGKIAIDAALALPALVSAGVLADSMRDARQVTMPGVAHLPNMEHPDAFNRIALEFLPAAQL